MVLTERLPFRRISSTLRRFNNPSLAIFIGRDGYLTGGLEWDAPGGKSGHWQANLASPSSDMPVASFYGWTLKVHLSQPPAPGKRRLTEAYIPANDSRAHAVREAGRPRDGRVIGHWTSDRKSLPRRRREGGDFGPEPSSSPGGDPEPANVRRCAADSR